MEECRSKRASERGNLMLSGGRHGLARHLDKLGMPPAKEEVR
jgi:hypothetical protein